MLVPEINLKYGRDAIAFQFDERFDVIGDSTDSPSLTDVEIGNRLDHPIGSKVLEDIVRPGESVLFVVPDATRRTGCGQIINLLVRRLIANGSVPFEMSVIFATGIHRQVTAEEKQEILTPFIAQRIKMLDHNPRDLARLVRMVEIAGGIPVELNSALTEFDHVVLLGGVTFHYFAGFTGGRKLICPGLASARTVSATHKLAFDCDARARRDGVGTGLLDGNAVHEAFVEAASAIKPSFAISTFVNDSGDVTEVFCGDWIASHRAACDEYAKRNTVPITDKRDLVIVSCGGSPYDVNLIQAHKALEAASHACSDGGTIILFAACNEGLGRPDFLDWFSAKDSNELAERLCEKYQVNGQTAWSLLRKAERFDVRIITELDEEVVRKLRCRKIGVDDLASTSPRTGGYIVASGAKMMIRSSGR